MPFTKFESFFETPTDHPLKLSEKEIAWLAGPFEGEATFNLDKRSLTRYKNSTAPALPYISIAMVDKDVSERVAVLVKKKVLLEKRSTKTGKQVYRVHIGDRVTVAYILETIYEYMGERRRLKIDKCLQALAEWQKWKKEKRNSQNKEKNVN